MLFIKINIQAGEIKKDIIVLKRKLYSMNKSHLIAILKEF